MDGYEKRWHRNIPPARKYPTIFEGKNKHVAVLTVERHIWTDEELEQHANLIAAAQELLKGAKAILAARGAEQSIRAISILRDAIVKAEGWS